ncbi:MAG: hypothetical protein AB8B69_02265 [Chitinophagales bacterium]
MYQQFTQEDLIRYWYNEVSPEECKSITEALNVNWELKEQYEEIQATFDVLDKVVMRKPNLSSIKIIMDYSQKTQAMETQC